ncbi:hypothetical protein AB0I94_25300 [Streptomyces sp. NPDC050147]|uniref:hypothetical protein n=1 Tax=Streptomyces sp. NPDC050147 TaxID=3155513 RepID=UPI003432DB22
MPKPIPMSRRRWIATWAVLCVAGLATTVALNASAPRDPQPKNPVSAECGEYIADIEMQLAKAKQEGQEDGVLAFSRVQVDTKDDCRDELRNHFGSDR